MAGVGVILKVKGSVYDYPRIEDVRHTHRFGVVAADGVDVEPAFGVGAAASALPAPS